MPPLFYVTSPIKRVNEVKYLGLHYTTKWHVFLMFYFQISADHESDLRFSLARQAPEIILNESSKNTENALIEWLPKETTRYFPKIKVYVVSLDLSLIFKTVFGIVLAPLVYLESVK
jgi:hypothetical protein